MHYYQHHIGDFIKDTYYLTNEEVGIYMKLLWLYYDQEHPLEDDPPLLAEKSSARDQISCVQKILNRFFQLENGFWRNSRADKEIAEYQELVQNKAKAGRASAEQRKKRRLSDVEQPLNICLTDEQLTSNHKPVTNNQEPSKNKATKVAAPDGVSILVWADFLTLRRSKKLPVTETALKGIEREALKARLTMDQAIRICCERGWGSFKADWIKDKKPQLTGQQSAWLTITGQTANFEEQNHGRTIEADPLPPALLG